MYKSAHKKEECRVPPDVEKTQVAENKVITRLFDILSYERSSYKLVYDNDNLREVHRRDGAICKYDYSSLGDLTSVHEADGTEIKFSYDQKRRIIERTGTDGWNTAYKYNENDKLSSTVINGISTCYQYDSSGRVSRILRGNAGASVFEYESDGKLKKARTSCAGSLFKYDANGRCTELFLEFNGVNAIVRFGHSKQNLLHVIDFNGVKLEYRWNLQGRPDSIEWQGNPLVKFRYSDASRETTINYANGAIERTCADPIDGHMTAYQLESCGEVLENRKLRYDQFFRVIEDAQKSYRYDHMGRLCEVHENGSLKWAYQYDCSDNCTAITRMGIREEVIVSAQDTPVKSNTHLNQIRFKHDLASRRKYVTDKQGEWWYRYNDAGQLIEVIRNGQRVASYEYDFKGRVLCTRTTRAEEWYVYGLDDELIGVTDSNGNVLRMYIRSPLGIHGVLDFSNGTAERFFFHHDGRGTLNYITDAFGSVVSHFQYEPFGKPSDSQDSRWAPMFKGRFYHADTGLYYCGARWYDPATARFLSPDSYTGAPDDERIVNPLISGSSQAAARTEILGIWLKQPAVRNRYIYCVNDPVNRTDPNGHWSFGGVLLMLLGAIWTLPNTIFGLVIEITCLVGEVIRWLVWLLTAGNVSWETPGFDAAASGRLNAFALVFKGGWLGSFSSLLGITFGNVIFVYKDWQNVPLTSGTDPVFPTAYDDSTSFPKNEALYEHELRHTVQYGWFGPFYHLGLPVFGVYEWDVILNGYQNAWLERDAISYGGI